MSKLGAICSLITITMTTAAAEEPHPTQHKLQTILDLQEELTAARNRWSSFNTQRYYYEYDDLSSSSSSSGNHEEEETVVDVNGIAGSVSLSVLKTLSGIYVQNNQVVNVFGNELLGVESSNSAQQSTTLVSSSVMTIEDLFDNIQLAIDQNYDQMYVSFDSDYGYPSNIMIFRFQTSQGAGEGGEDDLTLFGNIQSFTPISQAMDEFDAAKLRWDGLGLDTYQMNYSDDYLAIDASSEESPYVRGGSGEDITTSAGINLAGTTARVLTVRVDDNTVTSIESSDKSGHHFTADVDSSNVQTIDEMFQQIEADLKTTTHMMIPTKISIQYNPYYGYPESVELNLRSYDEDQAQQQSRYKYALMDFAPIQWHIELGSARQLWESQRIHSYSFDYESSEIGHILNPRASTTNIYVENGTILTANGEPVEHSIPVYTIDGLLNKVQQGYDGGIFMETPFVKVDYDPTYGYPVKLWMDYEPTLVDDNIIIQVSNFKMIGRDDTILDDSSSMTRALVTSSSMVSVLLFSTVLIISATC